MFVYNTIWITTGLHSKIGTVAEIWNHKSLELDLDDGAVFSCLITNPTNFQAHSK